MAGLALAVAGGACVFADDDQGTESIGFVTPLSHAETHARTLTFFQLEGYTLVDSSSNLIRAEKVRPLASGGGQERDVFTVTLRTEPEGTRVTVAGLTYIVENGQAREAPQNSPQLSQDWDRLIQFLMGPRP
ncbi:MAG TPA: hypothetical protein VFO85_00215 [Vicinamibacteria bacterium]|nr:hypothetical protein [Vicinamibacteria bacterium]